MKRRWEYLTLVWFSGSNGVTTLQNAENVWWVNPPGRDPEPRPDDSAFVDIANELGNDGWELVADVIVESAIAYNVRGWSEVGTPVGRRWTFKREADAEVQ